MRHQLLVAAILILGCSSPAPDASIRSDGLGASPPPPPGPWLAFDAQDHVVAFEPDTGAVVATGPPLPGIERDLAFDPYTGEVAVFASPEGEGGAIHRLSPTLQPQSTEPIPIDGRVELWFGPEGLWLFEESYGQRWRRLRHDAVWEPSWPLPPPSSLWADVPPRFGALVAAEAGSAWLAVDPTSATIPQVVHALPTVIPAAGAARAAPLAGGLAVAWSTVSGLRICLLDASGGLVTERFVSLEGPVRQAAALSVDEADWLALLLDEPPRLAAIELGPGAGSAVQSLTASIDGDLRVDRRMVSSGARVLVATSAGVEALVFDATSETWSADPGFAGEQLRGPLQAVSDTSPFQPSGGSGL